MPIHNSGTELSGMIFLDVYLNNLFLLTKPNLLISSLAGSSPTVSEAELYRSIQAVLPRETDKQLPDCFNKGTMIHHNALT